jgi:hypothetical protein
MLYCILHLLHCMAKIFKIRTVSFSVILMTPLSLYCFFFCSNEFFFYKFSPNHIFTSSRFSCLSLVYRHVNNFYDSIGPNRDLQSYILTHKTRIAQKMSSRLFCTNTLTVASLTSPTMRRDYYRGSQDSLTAAHLDDRRCSGPLYRGGSLRGMHYTHSLSHSIYSMQSHTHSFLL